METITRRHYQNDTGITISRDAEGNLSREIEGYAIRFNEPSAPFAEDGNARVVEYISPEAVSADFLRSQDVKMTLYHDMHRLLARSKRGEGSLSYSVDDEGVKFRFTAPNTSDGDMALELVKRGDIDGCSFMFGTYYDDRDHVSREVRKGADGKKEIVYTVRKITGLYDFTLTPDPAYPSTSVNAAKRDLSEIDNPETEELGKVEAPEPSEEPEQKRSFDMEEYLNLIKLSR